MKSKLNLIFTVLFLLLVNVSAFSCPVCNKQQPKITQGLTHGAGPQNNWDWVIIVVITLITLVTFFCSLKFLVKPGEKNADHIKRSILS